MIAVLGKARVSAVKISWARFCSSRAQRPVGYLFNDHGKRHAPQNGNNHRQRGVNPRADGEQGYIAADHYHVPMSEVEQ